MRLPASGEKAERFGAGQSFLEMLQAEKSLCIDKQLYYSMAGRFVNPRTGKGCGGEMKRLYNPDLFKYSQKKMENRA